jgi:hypothetical protein
MNALDLMERLGGEILMNKVHARIDGEIVIVAYLDEQNEWVYTDAGQLLANEHSNLAVDEASATKPRKIKTQLVESVEITSEPEVGLTQATE